MVSGRNDLFQRLGNPLTRCARIGRIPLAVALLLGAMCMTGCARDGAAKPRSRYTFKVEVIYGIDDTAHTIPLLVDSEDDLADFARSIKSRGFIAGKSSAYIEEGKVKHYYGMQDGTRGCVIIAGEKSIKSIELVTDRQKPEQQQAEPQKPAQPTSEK